MKQKDKIINYVLEAFLKEGFYGIKFEDIAVSLNISKRSIYKIFPTEQELLREVLEKFMHAILEA
jgi:AcrR family transcriptional regulator